MAITLNLSSQLHPKDLSGLLAKALPQYKVKSPPLNPNAVMVQNGTSMVLVTHTHNGLKIAGGLNTAHFGLALGVGVGVLLGFIGALIFLGVMYMSNQENFKRMEEEVAGAIRKEALMEAGA